MTTSHSGPADAGSTPDSNLGEVLHCIDEPTRWDNPVPLILVRGWCFKRGRPAVTGILARSTEGTWAGWHGLPRPDVARHFDGAPGAADSGFALRVPRPACCPARLEIVAVLADGSEFFLAAPMVT